MKTLEELSPRERQLVGLLVKAKSNKEIALELGLSKGTVKEYMNTVFRKLGMNRRTEVAVWAVKQQQTN